ncbi:UMP kinase [Candidatus Thorarchaeota archaeon]|nr:MAG: UMP kinase [Candidatus Thorarchaeota archaeon]
MRAVLKLGGSLLYSQDGSILTGKIEEYAKHIVALADEGHQLVIVVGGGRAARAFIAAARELGADESRCDWFGIRLARHNAELLAVALGDYAYPKVVESLEELDSVLCLNRVVVMGGLTPGQSTNAVAALAAEVLGADAFFNATNVDGVYDRDPSKPGAKKLHRVSVEQLEEVLASGGTRAGEYKLFDPVAIRVVARSHIKTMIFNGNEPENLVQLFKGTRIGTVVYHNSKDKE